MEGSPSGDGADGGSNPALSWREVQSICAEMETMFQTDAPKDAERLQALIDKRKEMAAAAQTKQAAANKQLQRTRSLSEGSEAVAHALAHRCCAV